MKIARFRPHGWPATTARVGALLDTGDGDDGAICDLAATLAHVMVEREGADPAAAAAYAAAVLPGSTVQLLGAWHRTRPVMDEVLAEIDDGVARDAVGPLGPVTWERSAIHRLTPLDEPPTIRDFFAFETHMKNSLNNLGLQVPSEWYEAPSHYITRSSSIFGPDDEAVWPHYTEKLDYELEFAIVIGTQGKDIRPEDAWSHIAGFTIYNDLSCRDVQRREMGTRVGPAKTKGFDGATGLGPYLVTADEFDPSFDVGMRAYVNDELWSEGRSGTIYWSVASLVAHAAAGETLHPGDVLGSGTVGTGAGLEIDRWLSPGDTIRLEIDGIGALENLIVRQPAP